MSPDLRIFDDVVPDVAAYRGWALGQTYGTVSFGPGVDFHGIAPVSASALQDWWVQHLPELPAPAISFFRQSPAGQQEPNYIHTDCDMGSWTGILYLTPDPHWMDGTTFWRDTETGAVMSTTTDPLEAFAWRDLSRWEREGTIAAQPGRLIVFPAARYHSRALVENYGQTADGSARLVQVVFAGPATARGGMV